MKFILGQKIGMSQIFDEKGNVIPITIVEAGPCYVTQVKNKEKDNYEAIQVGFGEKKKLTKALGGHLKGVGKKIRFLKEFKSRKKGEILPSLKLGDVIDVSVFQEGDTIEIAGFSKGKGFAGAVKRWHFAGKPATHGTKHEERGLGSIGSRYPQRVVKGRRMPGRMGFERVTMKNLKVVKVDKEHNVLAIKGALPGRRGTLLEIRG